MNFIIELQQRNPTLFRYSLTLLLCALVFVILINTTSKQINGVNVWYKPLKFALSIAIYCLTMSWFIYELPEFNVSLFNRVNIILFTFEIGYITLQAARGQESHFNQTTPLYTALFAAMGIAAAILTLYGGYVGYQYFVQDVSHLPSYYVWAIRFGIILFVIFAFEGVLMGSRQTHTVGTIKEPIYLPIFKWNMTAGDLRVAHFIGMHALQVLPLIGCYILRNTTGVMLLSCLYLTLAVFVFLQAQRQRPFITTKNISNVQHQ